MTSPPPDPDPHLLEELFFAAHELTGHEQAAFIREHCASHPRLRQALEALLSASQQPSVSLLDLPALEIEARSLAVDALPFGRLGPYRILSCISSGGMGAVYLAERDDQGLSKRVAIKTVHRAFDDMDAALVRRFQQERQILARLEHPNIARLLDGGVSAEGLPYLVMEYVEGLPIDRYAAQQNLPVAACLNLFGAVCSAVSYAHANLIVHRDLKPGNILVTAEGIPKLLDFGIAKLLNETFESEASTSIMTPGYASPEQAAGLPITTASDVYSLGVILYELLVGGKLFPPGSTQTDWAAEPIPPSERLRATDPPVAAPPDARRKVTSDLDSVLQKALRRDPGCRYASVADLSEDVRRILGGYPVKAKPGTFAYRARRFVARRRGEVAIALVAFLAVLVAGVITLVQYRDSFRRFQEARAFVNSLLFELNDAITDLPGSTPARLLLARRARQYLDILASEHSSDPAVQRDLALAYRRLGDVLGRPYYANLGDTAGALANYQQSAALLEKLYTSGHQDAALITELGLVYGRLGKVMKREKKPEETIRLSDRAVGLLQRAVALNPGSRDLRLELANAWLNLSLGWVSAAEAHAAGEPAARAESTAQQALDIVLPLMHDDPQNDACHYAAARAYQCLAYAYRDKSRTLQQHLLAHDQIAAAYRLNPARYRRLLAASLDDLSRSYLETGEIPKAAATARQHLLRVQEIAAADPSNSEVRGDVAWGLLQMGRVLRAQNRIRETLADDTRAVAILEALQRDPNSADLVVLLTEAHDDTAAALQASGDRAGAITHYRRSLDLLAGLPENVRAPRVAADDKRLAELLKHAKLTPP